jgi:hypothetical protein
VPLVPRGPAAVKRLALVLLGATALLAPPWSAHAQAQYEAPFVYSPGDPLTDEEVTFRSRASGGEAWDLDADGSCDDARGPAVRHRFRRPGRYRVTLCLFEGGVGGKFTQEVLVADPQPTFALVRLAGSFTRTSTRITLLRVRRSPRARIGLRCRGRDCPYRRRSIPPGKRLVSFRGLQRRLRAGTRISIYVTQPRRIGRYTAYRMRPGRRPARQDRCLRLASLRFRRCPD